MELSGGRSREDFMDPPAAVPPTVVGYGEILPPAGRKLAPPAASVAFLERWEVTLAFKGGKDKSRSQPEVRTQSSKSPRNFFWQSRAALF